MQAHKARPVLIYLERNDVQGYHKQQVPPDIDADSPATTPSSDFRSSQAAPTADNAAVGEADAPLDRGAGASGCLMLPMLTRYQTPLVERVRSIGSSSLGSSDATAGSQPAKANPLSDGAVAPTLALLQPPDTERLLLVYRAQYFLACRQYKHAKLQIKALQTGTGTPSTVASSSSADGGAQLHAAAAMLQVQLAACQQRVREAFTALTALITEPDAMREAFGVELFNNLGVLHHLAGKHQLAALYFTKAQQALCEEHDGSVTVSTQQQQQQPTPQVSKPVAVPLAVGGSGGPALSSASLSSSAPRLLPDRSPAVMYNAGLQHLMLKNYSVAHRCFQCAAVTYHQRPALWLRQAEACIGMFRQEEAQRSTMTRSRLLGQSSSSPAAPINPEEPDAGQEPAGSSSDGGSAPHGLLDTSRHYLQLALQLLDEEDDCQRCSLDDSTGGGSNAASAPEAPRTSAGGGASSSNHAAGAPQPHTFAGGAAAPPGQPPLSRRSRSSSSDASERCDRLLVSGCPEPPPPVHGFPLRCAVLVNQAHLALLLEDWQPALSAAQQLLALPGGSRSMAACTSRGRYWAHITRVMPLPSCHVLMCLGVRLFFHRYAALTICLSSAVHLGTAFFRYCCGHCLPFHHSINISQPCVNHLCTHSVCWAGVLRLLGRCMAP